MSRFLRSASSRWARCLLIVCLATPLAFATPGPPPKAVKRVLSLYSETTRLLSRSTAPVYSIATTYLGTGTVAGRLTKPVVEPPRYAFDSRVLERFPIPETRLPAGSEALFLEPAAYILAAVFFLLMETALVAMLLVERRRTKQAKSLLERRFSIERFISECSTKLSECPADKVDVEIERGLDALLALEGADRASWFVMDDSGVGVRNMISVHRPGMSPEPDFYDRPELPWITQKLRSGQTVILARLHDLPPEAQADRSFLEEGGAKSLAFVHFHHAATRGLLVLSSSMNCARSSDRWINVIFILLRVSA